jgi:molybdopterin-biosynthesis enzyme MoeA-like protein
MKMAFVPSAAALLDNPISSAPGFKIENVFVMAGIPKIFQVMFEASKKDLLGGKKIMAKEIKLSLTESVIAKDFAILQKKYSHVIMGSYPFDGGTSLVFRSIDEIALNNAINEMIIILQQIDANSILKIS